MMDHIVAHSIRVSQVAILLVDHLSGTDPDLDRDLVLAAALCHDITKTRSFETGESHAETAGDVLEAAGYEAVSRIAAQHVRLDSYDLKAGISEAAVVNYSDKRVLHDQVVSLTDRFDYIRRRYARNDDDRERIGLLARKTAEVEGAIFTRLPFAPEALADQLDPGDYRSDIETYHSMLRLRRDDVPGL